MPKRFIYSGEMPGNTFNAERVRMLFDKTDIFSPISVTSPFPTSNDWAKTITQRSTRVGLKCFPFICIHLHNTHLLLEAQNFNQSAMNSLERDINPLIILI